MTASRKQQSDLFNQNTVRIEPWGKGDLPLLKKLLGDPAMTEHLGGPESDEQLVKRQARYERLTQEGKGRMFKIVPEATGEAIGSVGYWESTHHGEDIYEMGWSVLPAFQGRGIASAAVAQALVIAHSDGKYRFLMPSPLLTTSHQTPSAGSRASPWSRNASLSTPRAVLCCAMTGTLIFL